MATDNFASTNNTANPATRSAIIVPGDGEIEVTRSLYVQTGGTLTIRLKDDASDWQLTVGDQTLLPFRVKMVRAAGTTASGIRGLY